MIYVKRKPAPQAFYQLEWRTRYLDSLRQWLQQPPDQRMAPPPLDWRGDKVRQLLPLINELFAHKCAFCEARLEPGQQRLIYFRPQKDVQPVSSHYHYHWLSLDWSNLYLSCRDCLELRGSEFPVANLRVTVHASHLDRENAYPYFWEEQPLLLDPCLEAPIKHLDFHENGEITARSRSIRGKRTIEIFELNRTSLVEKRRQAAQQLKTVWRAACERLIHNAGNIDANLIALVDQLAAMCDRSAPFAGMKAYLLLEWLHSEMTAADDSASVFCTAIEKEPWLNVYQKTLETLKLEKPPEVLEQVETYKSTKPIKTAVSTVIQETEIAHIYIYGDMYQIGSISHSTVGVGLVAGTQGNASLYKPLSEGMAKRNVHPEKSQTIDNLQIDTSDGAYIDGNVNTDGGDLISRDKTVHGDEVRGDKVAGDKTAIHSISHSSGIAIGRGAQVNINSSSTFAEFNRLLDALHAQLANLKLEDDEQIAVQQDLANIKSQLAKPDPKLILIKRGLNNIKDVLEVAIGAEAQPVSALAQRSIIYAESYLLVDEGR